MTAYTGKGCWQKARCDRIKRVAFLMFDRGDNNKEVAYLLGVTGETVRRWRGERGKAAGE